jgi:hypothetical protein
MRGQTLYSIMCLLLNPKFINLLWGLVLIEFRAAVHIGNCTVMNSCWYFPIVYNCSELYFLVWFH